MKLVNGRMQWWVSIYDVETNRERLDTVDYFVDIDAITGEVLQVSRTK